MKKLLHHRLEPSDKNFKNRVVRMQDRDNLGKKLLTNSKHQGFLMLNSSYTTGCDPNTMRDFGPLRNTVFNIEARSMTSKNSVVIPKRPKTAEKVKPDPIVRTFDCTKNIS